MLEMPETLIIPPGYEPFKKLVVCGNTMINGLVPVSYHNTPVFLIGKGREPGIWLNALTSTGWQPLIRESRSLHNEVRIESKAPMTWTVFVANTIVLEVFVRGEDEAEITKLDLRPVGLQVYGDQTELHLGTNRFVGNRFFNVQTMIAGGEKAN